MSDPLLERIDELEDDLVRMLHVRAAALEIAAAVIQPGPDGQDYLDRSRMIVQWVEQAHEQVGEDGPHTQRISALMERAAAPVVQRDYWQREVEALRARLDPGDWTREEIEEDCWLAEADAHGPLASLVRQAFLPPTEENP